MFDEEQWEAPRSFSPIWNPTENQDGLGACQGFSLAKCGEIAYWYATGKSINFSNGYCYIRSQEYDGINGDSGSTLSGGTKCAQDGFALEADLPYVQNYNSLRSNYRRQKEELLRQAKSFRLDGAYPLKNYDEILAFLQSGMGAVHIGIFWTVPDKRIIDNYVYRRTGGHAVIFSGWSEEKDSSGNPLIEMINSWGPGWGELGRCWWTKRAVNQCCAGQWNVFIGRSDMVTPKPRHDYTRD